MLGFATSVAFASVVWGGRDIWLFIWSETDAMVGRSLQIVLPVVIATSSYLAAVRTRSGIEQLAAGPEQAVMRSRRRMAVELCVVAGSSVLLGTAVMWGLTGTTDTYGGPQILSLLPVLGWLSTAVLVGVLVGSRWPRIWTPVVLAMVTYTLIVVVVFRMAGPPAVSAHTLDDRSMSFFTSAWWVYILQALVPTGAIVWLWGRRWSGAAVVSLALTACFMASNFERRPDPGAAEPVCRAHDEIDVCLPTAKAYLSQEVARSYLDVLAIAPVRASRGDVLLDDEAAPFTGPVREGVPGSRGGGSTVLLSAAGLDLSAVSSPDPSVMRGMWVRSVLRPTAVRSDRRVRWVVERQAMRDLGLPTDGTLYPGAAAYDAVVPDAESVEVARLWESRGAEHRRRWLSEHGTSWRLGKVVLEDLR